MALYYLPVPGAMMFPNSDTIAAVELETVIDNLPIAVLVMDRDRKIILANRIAREFTGCSSEELSGIRLGVAYFCKNSLQNGRGCGFGTSCESCFIKKQIKETVENNHKKKVCEGKLESVKFGNLDLRVTSNYLAERDCVLVSIEDLTHYKALERDSEEKNKLQAAIETAGAICHEMNQPLQVISGYLDLILSTELDIKAEREYLNITRAQTVRLGEIVCKLRNLKRYRTSEYAPGNQILDIANSIQE
jgi:nitrogen-specific signal transduction histidine kinase